MNELTKIEEMLLIGIWRLKEDAYGYKIRKYISEIIQKDFTYGNLYSALGQLVKKGYVPSVKECIIKANLERELDFELLKI